MQQLELLPVCRQSETSRAAAAGIGIDKARAQQARVLECIRSAGPHGATDAEIQAALSLAGDSERPRRAALVSAGLVVNSGQQRRTQAGRLATVWVCTALGRQAGTTEPTDRVKVDHR